MYRIRAAFLARQVPTSGRRKTVAKTDSRGWTAFGRPLRYRIQAMIQNAVAGRKKKYTTCGLVRRGRPLTSQTAFGGQLPYKGSLVRPAARFDYNPFMYDGRFLRATSICHGTGYSQKSRLPKRTAVAGQPAVRVNHNPFEYNVDFYEPRTTNHGLFHEPRVTRGDVVTLNLLPRSGI